MQTPEKGFYYHHKHDPSISLNHHAYEVLGVSWHTEDDTYSVVYRPLYENTFLIGADFCNRPLEMFLEKIEKEGKRTSRFSKVTDEETITLLSKIRDEMYGDSKPFGTN